MQDPPRKLQTIQHAVTTSGFNMPSEPAVGGLLRCLAATKPAGRFLELGTGLGLSLAWIADGMDPQSTVISIENDPNLAETASNFFRDDTRVTILEADGGRWLTAASGQSFDLLFADTWPGKYHHLEEALGLLAVGGIYLVDDMLPQENWPAGHAAKANALREYLFARTDLLVSELKWASGVILAVKK